jgi:hypothetical protein
MTTSNTFPFLEGLPEEDRHTFYQELMAITQQCLDLGSPMETYADRLEENFNTWARMAKEYAEQVEREKQPGLLSPGRRHYAQYGYQRVIEIGGPFVNHCSECDLPFPSDIHFVQDTSREEREGAVYRRGDILLQGDRYWGVCAVGEWAYVLRPLTPDLEPEEGEYVWMRGMVEDRCELVKRPS